MASFAKSLGDNSSKYSELVLTRIRTVFDGCAFGCLADVKLEDVRDFLQQMRTERDIGHRTYNHYLQGCDSFLNWCVRTKRLLSNPLVGIERLNTEIDVRHPRRALTHDEIEKLLRSVAGSGKNYQRQTPRIRVRIYTVAYLTGLRHQELASLRLSSFRLDDVPPTLTVDATVSKHRRKDVLPMHPQLVENLRDWTNDMKPRDRLFPGLATKKLYRMIQLDLRDAGIPYQTEEGIADFHAAGRHTYITQLIRSGVSLPTAMELARHSDVKMTMRYTHIGIADQAAALASLPAAPQPVTPGSALHGRCISGGGGCHKGAESDIGVSGPKKEKRRKSLDMATYGVQSQGLAETLKVEAAGIEPASRDISM
jgi:integrase